HGSPHLKSSKAHLAHVSTLSGRARARIRPVMRADGEIHRAARFPAAFRPPAFASWAILFPPRNQRPSRSAFQTVVAARTSTGFPRSACARRDRVGCLLYPGAAVLLRPAR